MKKRFPKLPRGKSAAAKLKRPAPFSLLILLVIIIGFAYGANKLSHENTNTSAQYTACDGQPCDADLHIFVLGLSGDSSPVTGVSLFSPASTVGTCSDPNNVRSPSAVIPNVNDTFFYRPTTGNPELFFNGEIYCRGFQFGPPSGVRLYANPPGGYTYTFTANQSTTSLNGSPYPAGVDCAQKTYCTFNYDSGTGKVQLQFTGLPPSAPSLSVSGSSASSISLSWSAANSVANAYISSYAVFRNGSQIGSTAAGTRSFTNSSLSCGQSYTYSVQAIESFSDSATPQAKSNSNTVSGSTAACASTGGGSGGGTTGGGTTGGGTTGGGTTGGGTTGGGTTTGGGSTGGGTTGGSSGGSSGGGATTVPRTPTTPGKAPSSGSSGSSSSPAVASDTSPPSVPGNFSAAAADGGVGVILTWDASTDNTGTSGYSLDRSEDNGQTWTTLDNAITQIPYLDTSIKFDTHYKYRLVAFDARGNTSGYANAEISISSFQPNVGPHKSQELTSKDNQVTVSIPEGAVSEDVVCSIETDLNLGSGPSVTGYILAGGPYNVICKNADSVVVTSFSSPLSVTVSITPYKKYTALAYYGQATGEDKWSQISPVVRDKSKSTDTFEMKDGNVFAVMGKVKHTPGWIKLLLTILVLILIIGGIIGGGWVLLRFTSQRRLQDQYDDYYRKSQGL